MSENSYLLALTNRENRFGDELVICLKKERLETGRDVSAFNVARLLRATAAILK